MIPQDRSLHLHLARTRGRAIRRIVPTDVWRGTAFKLDIGQTHGEISVLRIVGEQPAIEMLIHHRCGNGEMQRRRSAIIQWLWVELCVDRWGVINNPQMRAAREQAKVAWMLWRRRMMQKLSGIAFYDSIDIMDAQLAFVDQKPVRWRFAFEKCDRSFDSPNSADKRSDQQRNDTEVRDQKREMMFAPWPTRERGTGKVCSKQNKPKIEPGRPVNIGARDIRIEARFIERARDRGDNDHRKQDHREFKRCEEFEDGIALPSGPLG